MLTSILSSGTVRPSTLAVKALSGGRAAASSSMSSSNASAMRLPVSEMSEFACRVGPAESAVPVRAIRST